MANPNLQLLTDAAKWLKPILGELVFVADKTASRNGNFAFLINSEYHPKAHSTSNSDHRNPLECLPVTQQVSAKATL
jgi:hypothetical protein